MFCVGDQFMENDGAGINSIQSFLVFIVEQAQIGSKEIPCQKR